jgi:hypothetical protein
MFEPALPQRKVQAIERLGMGVVDKIFINFHFPFQAAPIPTQWRSVSSYQLLWKVCVETLWGTCKHSAYSPTAPCISTQTICTTAERMLLMPWS